MCAFYLFGFRDELDRAHGEEHLELARVRDHVPGLVRQVAQRAELGAVRQVAGERHAGGVDEPARGSEHGDARVLQLSRPVPQNGLI